MISVCMATYNGKQYLDQQVSSILSELSGQDELIIVDDASSDDTVSVLRSIPDPRIKLYINRTNKGVNVSFNRAISLASGTYIFLADQDDVWIEGRVATMLAALYSNKAMLVTSNSCYIDSNNETVHASIRNKKASESHNYLGNIFRIFLGVGNYPGCAMLVHSNLLKVALPFPRYIESHDLWIAMCANLMRSNYHVENACLKRRVHGNNFSLKSRTILSKIKSRLIHLISLVNILYRVIRFRLYGC